MTSASSAATRSSTPPVLTRTPATVVIEEVLGGSPTPTSTTLALWPRCSKPARGCGSITSFLGVGIMGLSSGPLPMDRVHLINPGQSVTVGDHRLTAVKPPVYDNPITTGFVDDRTGILFSFDCFGALLPAVPQDAADLDTDQLQAGQVRWATIDSPWGARRRPPDVRPCPRPAPRHRTDHGVQQPPPARPRRHGRRVRRLAGT